jgi:hypothetical protein
MTPGGGRASMEPKQMVGVLAQFIFLVLLCSAPRAYKATRTREGEHFSYTSFRDNVERLLKSLPESLKRRAACRLVRKDVA